MTTLPTDPDTWIRRYHQAPDSAVQLVCFPHAGGSASFFFPVSTALSPTVEVSAVQYPGRQDRRAEPNIDSLPALADAILPAVRPLTDRPLAFFGHSMGALLAYELTLTLRAAGDPLPRHLFVSGRRAPHLPERRRPLHALPEQEFREELGRLQGTPKAVLDDPELMDLLTPILRADFSVCETYAHTPADPLDLPLTVFGGAHDAETTEEELEGWRQHSRAFSRLRIFPGHHFFLHDQARAVTRAVLEEIGFD